MDLFFSCDIEGVSGAAAWGQLAPGTPELQALCGQMTREVAAACRAAVRAGGKRRARHGPQHRPGGTARAGAGEPRLGR